MYLDRAGPAVRGRPRERRRHRAGDEWFLAEGATGAFFDLFVLLANPTRPRRTSTVDYLLTDGSALTQDTTRVAANSRLTIWVDDEQFPAGPAAGRCQRAVSMRVRSTNGVPIIVERAMWWPAAELWYEAHNAPGDDPRPAPAGRSPAGEVGRQAVRRRSC